ncbi:MAG: TIGR04552 family protein [Deltaproteobacteria bacterium]|nr:MAG: TIGR04552 family protein [Deltaproteobacteria bacterium]
MRRDILELDTSLTRAIQDRQLTLHDVEAIRLLLSGSSVVDWQRLAFGTLDEVDEFLATLRLDVSRGEDSERLRYVFNESVAYLEEQLQLRFPPTLRDPDDIRMLFLWASQDGGFRRRQILSCVILKLMHVIQHMEAADLKFRTAISEAQLFDLAEDRLLEAARAMQDSGLPIVALYGSRKSRSSVITKLLAKRENIAATVFDKLRYRIIVEKPEDLLPVLQHLTRKVLPFNYVIPGQSHNNLLDPARLWDALPADVVAQHVERAMPLTQESGKNEFSGANYRMINFIADYPVELPTTPDDRFSFELGRVVFLMIEFQLVDEETARRNEVGENAHSLYKERQYEEVARRLKRGRGRR